MSAVRSVTRFVLVKALFHEGKDHYLVLISYCFVTLLLGGSVILLIALNIKWSLEKLKQIVGSSFVEKYYPPSIYKIRGLGPVLIFGLILFSLLLLDYLSLLWFLHLHSEEIMRKCKTIEEIYAKYAQGEYKAGMAALLLSEEGHFDSFHTDDIKGFFRILVNHTTIADYIKFFHLEK